MAAATARGGELLGAQRRLDLHGSFLDPALATTAAQRCRDLRAGQAGPRVGRRGHAEHLEGIAAGQVVERDEGGRVELPQCRAQQLAWRPLDHTMD